MVVLLPQNGKVVVRQLAVMQTVLMFIPSHLLKRLVAQMGQVLQN